MTSPLDQIPQSRPHTPLLDGVNDVAALRRLDPRQLPQLATELRQYMLFCVGQTGGHLGAGLGVVELTIALHYLLDTPHDKLIWDVGHQAYPHKILTGRKDAMLSMRQAGGLAPFPKRDESVFDCFGVGHSSTSISALLGMALVNQNQHQHVAVIGDGALTAGMAYEALNHLAHSDTNALVIINDNDMAISANQGGLANFLDGTTLMGGPKAWFTALGMTYVGPVDGNDLSALLAHLQALLALPGPKLLHLNTVKGKGFVAAEEDPVGYHAIDKIDPIGQPKQAKQATYAQVFGNWAQRQAEKDQRLHVVTPAMTGGSGLTAFAELYPQRLHDVAIAEQHAITLAAGMACAGAKPVVAIYSTFLQRGYDQLVHDVALQNLDVLFAIDRAGVVGEDGATHTGAYDFAYLACLPNMLLMAPSNAAEAEAMLQLGYDHKGPAAVRYPRGAAALADKVTDVQLAKANLIRDGKKLVILNFGALLAEAEAAASEVNACLVDMRFVKPLDTAILAELMSFEHWISVEDHAVNGGAGAQVAQWLSQQTSSHKPQLTCLGLADEVLAHGTREQVLANCGLDAQGLIAQCQRACFI